MGCVNRQQAAAALGGGGGGGSASYCRGVSTCLDRLPGALWLLWAPARVGKVQGYGTLNFAAGLTQQVARTRQRHSQHVCQLLLRHGERCVASQADCYRCGDIGPLLGPRLPAISIAMY